MLSGIVGRARSCTLVGRALHCILAVFAVTLAAHATPLAESSANESVTVRRHRITVDRRQLAYTSHTGRIPIRVAGTDEPRARMFYVAYRVAPRPGKVRPLTVIWNGGPGGSMMSILLGGQGPKRIVAGAVVDNVETILDQTDLLYIDAVGSGFSRLTGPADAATFIRPRAITTHSSSVFLAGGVCSVPKTSQSSSPE